MLDDSIITKVGQLLQTKNITLSVAESCTGGLLGHYLTNVSGSSSVFMGGVIAYSNQTKESLLNVTSQALLDYGAVSKEVAMQMAQGVRALLNTDYALSVTGIAGPGGAREGKPVGLVYIGLASAHQTIYRKYIWSDNREANKIQSALAALTLLEEVITRST